MSKKQRPTASDDTHVVANMNVEGMPWYRPQAKTERNAQEPLSKSEFRQVLGGAFLAAMCIAGIVSLLGVLFVLFCTKVWLR